MRNWLIPLLFILAACMEEKLTPESSLRHFVEGRIGKVVDRNFVLDRVTGKMKESFENMSDSDFTKFADLRHVNRSTFKILSKSCQDKKCFITYTISYTSEDKSKPAFVTDVKKIAEVLSIEGKWLIADVSNIKTYHEALEPISPLE
jgi:hypothetical protein